LPCCAIKRDHFDDDDELFIFVLKDMHCKTHKGLIIILTDAKLQNEYIITDFEILQHTATNA